MSAQEKRETMQRILFESVRAVGTPHVVQECRVAAMTVIAHVQAEVFNLKELESLGRKAGVGMFLCVALSIVTPAGRYLVCVFSLWTR